MYSEKAVSQLLCKAYILGEVDDAMESADASGVAASSGATV